MSLSKMHGLWFLFVILVVILIVNPLIIHNTYNNILGRVVLIALLIFFAMNNVTLGLLVALCIIIATNMYMFEGLENMVETKVTTGMPEDANTTVTDKMATDKMATDKMATDKMATDKTEGPRKKGLIPIPQPNSTMVASDKTDGVDREAVKSSLEAKPANSMPVNKSDFSSAEDVAPSSKESFGSMSAHI